MQGGRDANRSSPSKLRPRAAIEEHVVALFHIREAHSLRDHHAPVVVNSELIGPAALRLTFGPCHAFREFHHLLVIPDRTVSVAFTFLVVELDLR
jgi:hypothetical protein